MPITTIDKQQRTEALAEVGHLAASIEGAPEAELIEAYFRHAPAEDVTSRSPRGLLDLVIAHRELAEQRPAGTAMVECVTAPTDESAHTIVRVVTDDSQPRIVGAHRKMGRFDGCATSEAKRSKNRAMDCQRSPSARVRSLVRFMLSRPR